MIYNFSYDAATNTAPDGAFPTAGLIQGKDGAYPAGALLVGQDGSTLYGALASGGAGGYGTVFSYAGRQTNIYSFDTPETHPYGALIFGPGQQ